MNVRDYSKSAASNTALAGIFTGANMARSDVDDALRQLMAHIRQFADGVPVSVTDFGATGDGVTNDTAAIQAAVASIKGTGATLRIPAGTYLIGELLLDGSNYRVECDHGVTFKQKSGTTTDSNYHPSIKISGTGISLLGSIRFTGNIATDTGEWRPCVFVNAGSRRIRIGTLYGTDIRGDVLTVFGLAANPTLDVQVEGVSGTNVYRNLVSVIGGQVQIGAILNDGPVGYRDLCVEPNSGGSYQAGNVRVGYIRAGGVEVISDDPALQNEWFEVGTLDADWSRIQATTPAYPSAPGVNGYGLGYTLCKAGRIGHLILNGYKSYPVSFGASTLKSTLTIDRVSFANCSQTEATYKTIFREQPTGGMASLKIGHIEGALYSSSHRLFAVQPGFIAQIGSSNVTGGATGLSGATMNSVASAATITLPQGQALVPISGTTNITSITAGDENAGRLVALKFAAGLTVVNGSNLKIGADFVATADDVLLLCSDGINWYRAAAGAAN